MFQAKTYTERRNRLRKKVASGLLVFLGHEESPMNYPANAYPFRQDSSFLYFFGLDSPGLAGVVDADSGEEIIFGDDITLEDVIWMGELPSIKERAFNVGINKTAPLSQLATILRNAQNKGRRIHYLPPYRPETGKRLAELLGIPAGEIKNNVSEDLIRAVVALRSTKAEEEIAEIERALAVTRKMYLSAMRMARPGIYESDVVGEIDGIALAGGSGTAFPTILTMNGHVFHNLFHGNKLQKGRLLVIDAGAASPLNYASDITRTIPVSGKYTPRQKEVYEIVLAGQLQAISLIKPGIQHKEVHLAAAGTIAQGLKDIGLMKGNIDEAVAAGAHALFFPHGLGHMLGLDVHDMEGLGENFVGYDETVERSQQFGLAYLRMAKRLEPGFVLTCEPGVYFIPPLIDKWRKESKFADFINYEKVETYRDFTGIRIEDDVLVTREGNRVLGKPIPKKVKDVEKTMAQDSGQS
jgi:Xaa-Pro aminopeptidase